MKRLLTFLATCVITSSVSFAQGAAAPAQAKLSSLGIKVKEIGTKKQDVDKWKTDWGSYDRDTTRQKTIQVELTKFSKDPANDVQIWVLWIAKSAQSSGGEYVFKRDEVKLNLTGQLEPLTFTSPPITENNQKYWGTGQYTSGVKLAGYVIGIDYAGDSSKPHFSSGLSSITAPAKLKELVDTYEKRKRNQQRQRRSERSDEPTAQERREQEQPIAF